MVAGLSLLRRTSNRRTINLASWHSPHSLTWSWILSASWSLPSYERPVWNWSRVGPHRFYGARVGSIASVYLCRDNGGRQWGLCLLGARLNWSRQRPMWFRDLYRRQCDEQYGLSKEHA